MSGLRYYLDENVVHGPVVARELRARGVDAITALDAGRAGQEIADQEQLEYATRDGRVMVTQDLRFRPRLPHGGLIIMQRPLSLGEYIRYLQRLAERLSPGELNDQVHFYQP
jgi:hypothetical protein